MTQEQELQQIVESELRRDEIWSQLDHKEMSAKIAKAIIDSRSLRTGGVKELELMSEDGQDWVAHTDRGMISIWKTTRGRMCVLFEDSEPIPTEELTFANCQTHFNSLIGSCLTDEPETLANYYHAVMCQRDSTKPCYEAQCDGCEFNKPVTYTTNSSVDFGDERRFTEEDMKGFAEWTLKSNWSYFNDTQSWKRTIWKPYCATEALEIERVETATTSELLTEYLTSLKHPKQ